MTWKIEHAAINTLKLRKLLKNGWEPFGVACAGNFRYTIIWLRTQKGGNT